MTYKELLEFTKKHPNPFWNEEQHNKQVEYKYKDWLAQQNQKHSAEKHKAGKGTS
mgnify:FL=1